MRGHPLLQWLLFAAVWSCLAYPIYRIAGAVPEVERAEREETERTTVWMTVSFSSTPRNFAVVQEGREVWAVAEPSGYSMERRVELVKDAWGVDFRIRAELPEGRAAVEVMVEPEAGRRLARTLWVDGSFDEDVTFLSRGDD